MREREGLFFEECFSICFQLIVVDWLFVDIGDREVRRRNERRELSRNVNRV